MDIRKEKELSSDLNKYSILLHASEEGGENPAKRFRIDILNDHSLPCKNPGHSKSVVEAGTLNSDSASDEELEEHFVPLTSLPSVEAAISILKVRERILSYSSPQDLLQFRLVSRDWRRDATNDILLKWDQNHIMIEPEPFGEQCQAHSLEWNEQFTKPLIELSKLIDITGAYPFPCCRFTIYPSNNNRKISKEIQEFLKNHGSRMKILDLSLYYPKYCIDINEIDDTHQMCSHSINWLMQVITKTLLEHTQNLEDLEISYNAVWEFRGKTSCKPIEDKRNTENDCSNSSNFHFKLQSVTLWESAPKSIFEFFYRLAPNLKAIKDCNLEHYLEPINRLQLLDEIAYHPDSSDPQANDRVKIIANMEGKLRVKTLVILAEDIYEDSECYPEAVEYCHKLFEKCFESVESLVFAPLGFLPGLNIPKMPNVKELYCHATSSAVPETSFFPRGMSISEKFSSLHTIELCEGFTEASPDESFIIGCEGEVVPSVRVILTGRNSFHFETFKLWFPNAVIKDDE